MTEDVPLETCEWLIAACRCIFESVRGSESRRARLIKSLNRELRSIERKHRIVEYFVVKKLELGRFPPELKGVQLLQTKEDSKSDLVRAPGIPI